MPTAINYAQFSYPGILAYESVDFSDQAGITPSIAVVKLYPQLGFPDRFGEMHFFYNNTAITIPGCTLDSASIQRNSGGQIVSVRILDSRWRWAYGEMTLRANIRLPNNFVDPAHEMTPQQIASACFQAMGESNYDVSALPNDARPDIDWDGANPARSLADMCDDLGCRIVPRRSDATWVICVTGGDGSETLPDLLPYKDGGEGVDPKELPDFFQILTAPIFYQCALKLEPVGRDMDQSWRFPSKLSYCPESSGISPWGFGYEPDTMFNLSPIRELQPDGTAIAPREIAVGSLYRHWRIYQPVEGSEDAGEGEGDQTIWIDGLGDDPDSGEYVSRKQLILCDKLAQCYPDDRGAIHPRPAFVWGEFAGQKSPKNFSNYKPGTRIDFQATNVELPDEPKSFNVCLDPLDSDRSFVVTSAQMVLCRIGSELVDVDGYVPTIYDFANLFYSCAYKVRDPDTWQPIRYSRIIPIGDGGDPTNVRTVIKNDIQPWVINLYDRDGKQTSNTNNYDDVNNQCDFYLTALSREFETINTVTRTYIGLFPIDQNGAIQQVSMQISSRGAFTKVSLGTEHDFDQPPYSERRQRDGRRSSKEQIGLLEEIGARREATKGTFNTM